MRIQQETTLDVRDQQAGIAKTALGAEESVEWEHQPQAVPLLESLRGEGREIAAVETSIHSVDLYDWQPRLPVCVVFGNEVDGVAPEISQLADVHIRIPMLGVKQSLNVAVAGGVVLYEPEFPIWNSDSNMVLALFS